MRHSVLQCGPVSRDAARPRTGPEQAGSGAAWTYRAPPSLTRGATPQLVSLRSSRCGPLPRPPCASRLIWAMNQGPGSCNEHKRCVIWLASQPTCTIHPHGGSTVTPFLGRLCLWPLDAVLPLLPPRSMAGMQMHESLAEGLDGRFAVAQTARFAAIDFGLLQRPTQK